MQYPLEGVRVLDLSRVVSGPFAGRLLADLGADVVKVEPPDGDGTRVHGRNVGGISGFFSQQNAGKRNVCMDLRAPGARELVSEFVAVADVVIENYRVGVMRRLGIDYDVLSAINPRLVMLSISGFGRGGPESHRPSYAPVVHAEVGLVHRLGQRNETPPGDLPLSVADTNASLHGVIAVLAALRMRDRTGIGQHIDMSMMDATFATDDRAHFELEGVPDTIPVCPIFDLPFGRVFVSADARQLFARLVRRCGLADPAGVDADLETKIMLRERAVDAHLRKCETMAQFGELMEALDIPWGEVRNPRDLHLQPTLRQRGMIVQIDDRAGGTRPIAQSPYRFSNARSGVRGPAAHQGEHNRDVMKDWLQLDDAEVDRRIQLGVFRATPQ